jgi:hypothetical protein
MQTAGWPTSRIKTPFGSGAPVTLRSRWRGSKTRQAFELCSKRQLPGAGTQVGSVVIPPQVSLHYLVFLTDVSLNAEIRTSITTQCRRGSHREVDVED